MGHPSLSTMKVLLGTSWKLDVPNQRHRDVISGCQIGTSLGGQMGTFPWWSNRIFRGRPWDFGVGRPLDVLGTNICRLGLCVFQQLKPDFYYFQNKILKLSTIYLNDVFSSITQHRLLIQCLVWGCLYRNVIYICIVCGHHMRQVS